MPDGRPIVCVGFAEWDAELWTNQQHLMSRLSARRPVLFVESLGLRRPSARGRDLRRLARRLATGLAPPRRRGGVRVLSPLVLPLHRTPWQRRVNARLLCAGVRRAYRDPRRPVLWAYVPQAEALLATLDPAAVVYHCVDDIAAQDGVDAIGFRAAEERFARRADLVLASAPPLARRLSALNDNVVHAPNVADTALFARSLDATLAPDPLYDALPPGPRLVFTGAVAATKVDLDLLGELARARPAWQIILAGPVGVGDPTTDVSLLAAMPNVHLVGPRRYEDLPAVLRGADVALIPYVRSALTDSVFPMKVQEYLAAGLPVIASRLPSLADVPDVRRCTGAAEWIGAIEHVLRDPGDRAARSARAAPHSWDRRVREIELALERLEAGRA